MTVHLCCGSRSGVVVAGFVLYIPVNVVIVIAEVFLFFFLLYL
jgi:hypothetical protein